MTFRLPHLIAAVTLHVLLLGLLLGGLQCSAKPQRPPVISAVLLDPTRQQTAEQKRRDAAERRKTEEQKRREAEAQRRQTEELKKQQALAQQRKAEADKKKQDDAKKKQDELLKQKQLAAQKATDAKKAAEQKKADEAARKKQEQDAAREKEADARREAEERTQMAQALREEEARREAEREQAARTASALEVKQRQWADALERHISRNWVRPPSASEDFSCRLHLQLLPDGTVTNARIEQSCGSAQLDKSVEDAVYRASPLPKPEDPSVFDRDLTINFEP